MAHVRDSADVFSVPVRASLSGLAATVVHTGNADPHRSFVAVAQSLFWACALDEQLELEPGYKGERTSHYGGRILPALRIARNAVAHGIQVVAAPACETSGLDIPIVWRGANWVDYEDVRRGLDRDPAKGDENLWRTEVAGRNVPATLRFTQDWLIQSAHKYLRESPEI